MNYIIAGLFALIACFPAFGQDMPGWVKQRPVNSLYYTGIGRAAKSDKDHREVAKQNALKDLASEIRVEVFSNSLLHTLEKQNQVTSQFEESVCVKASEDLESFHMVGNWQNDQEYWVYYELSIMDYQEYITKRREDAIHQGYDLWVKGQEASERGELAVAVELWLKGLEKVQPVINEVLLCNHDGKEVDIARELYNSIKTVFGGVTLQSSVETIEAAAFKPVNEPVPVSLQRKGMPLKQVLLKAVFLLGDGRLSSNIVTNDQGEAKVYIENISSSLPRQEIRIGIDEKLFQEQLKGVFGSLLQEVLASAPRLSIRVNIEKNTVKAYLQVDKDGDALLQRAVREILTQNYFTIVSTPSLADMVVTLTSSSRKGEKERAGVSAVVAYYASVEVRIERREGAVVVLDYIPEEVKVLKPENVPETKARRAANDALLKLVRRQLPERLKDVYAE